MPWVKFEPPFLVFNGYKSARQLIVATFITILILYGQI